jgi:hypothetical protein
LDGNNRLRIVGFDKSDSKMNVFNDLMQKKAETEGGFRFAVLTEEKGYLLSRKRGAGKF